MSATKYQLKRVTVAIRDCASFYNLCCLMNWKSKSLNKQCFYRNNKMFSGIDGSNTCSNAVYQHRTAPQSFCHSFIALPMIRCSKSAQKSAVPCTTRIFSYGKIYTKNPNCDGLGIIVPVHLLTDKYVTGISVCGPRVCLHPWYEVLDKILLKIPRRTCCRQMFSLWVIA